MEKVKPILLVTIAEDGPLDMDGIDRLHEELQEHCEGYIVLTTQGKHQSAKILSARKMKRRDYQQVVNAAKKILRDG